MIFLIFALVFIAFGWYMSAAIALILGVSLEYFASNNPPGDDGDDD